MMAMTPSTGMPIFSPMAAVVLSNSLLKESMVSVGAAADPGASGDFGHQAVTCSPHARAHASRGGRGGEVVGDPLMGLWVRTGRFKGGEHGVDQRKKGKEKVKIRYGNVKLIIIIHLIS